jgi:hypothetical protein
MVGRLALFLLLTLVPIRAEAQCVGIPELPSLLLFYADGKTISFDTDPTEHRFHFQLMPGVMTLSCQLDVSSRPTKIELPFDKGKVCLGDVVIMKGQPCSVEAIKDRTLGDLPEVKWATRLEQDGSIVRSAPGWMAGYPNKK